MRELILKSLIKKQEERIPTLRERVVGYRVNYYYPDMLAYYTWVHTVKRFLWEYFTGDESAEEFCKLSKESISLEQQEELLAILNAIAALPTIIKKDIQMKNEKETNIVVNVSNNNTQSQNQEQSMIVQQFLDAFRDELTGRQLKELKSVIEEAGNDLQKAKPNIIAKLMEFGGNVASNILATLLTNSAFGLCL